MRLLPFRRYRNGPVTQSLEPIHFAPHRPDKGISIFEFGIKENRPCLCTWPACSSSAEVLFTAAAEEP